MLRFANWTRAEKTELLLEDRNLLDTMLFVH